MTKLSAKFIVVLMLLAASIQMLSTGCVPLLIGAGAGATGVAYLKGAVEETFEHDVRTVAAATARALESLEIAVSESAVSALDASFLGRTATDTPVRIVLKSISEGTSVSVRVGHLGDEALGQRVMSAIRSEL